MRKYVIVTDSCSDLNENLRSKYDIDYIPMHMTYDGKDVLADLDFKELSYKDFYKMLRDGTRFTTAQITANEYTERFEKYLSEGYDILSITCSSGLSASYQTSLGVKEELLKKYPDAKIRCVDSLNACFALGLLCIIASDMRKEGKTIDEVADFVEKNRLKSNQECTVEKLTYLKQAGRVSASSAFFGGLLNVKPIIISDALGVNAAIEKVKGKKMAYDRLIERSTTSYDPSLSKYVIFGHADCEEEALELKRLFLEKVKVEKENIFVEKIGPIIGATAGPGTVAIFFMGKEVTFNKKD